jgi:hypothetical protein
MAERAKPARVVSCALWLDVVRMPLSVKPNASSNAATSPGKRCGALARAAPTRAAVSGAAVVVVFVLLVVFVCLLQTHLCFFFCQDHHYFHDEGRTGFLGVSVLSDCLYSPEVFTGSNLGDLNRWEVPLFAQTAANQ